MSVTAAGAAAAPTQGHSSEIGTRLLLVMAIACGVVVANLYYAQPLLPAIRTSLHSGPGATSTVVVLSQLGYAAGLLFVVPLGDRWERRRFACLALLVNAVTLLVAAAAGSIGVLGAVMLAVGITSVVAQVLIPMAADLAGDDERGRVVGTLMTGVLVGVLLSRTAAGIVGQAGGWRAIYLVAAGLMVVTSAALWHELPRSRPTADSSYGQLLASVVRLVREEPRLRRRAAYGALAFGGFSVLWTSIAFLLARPPYSYNSAQIGLFGLMGVAGALCASIAGRLADRGWERPATAVFLLLTAASFVLLLVGVHHLWALLVGVLVLDFGVQGAHVSNQSVIYGLVDTARSRLTTAYMTTYFVGGALGSLAASAVYSAGGWTGVCVLGAALPGVALLLWLGESRVFRVS